MASYMDITKDNFEVVVGEAVKPILIDFWAEWCGPCKMIAPIFEELADEMEDVASFGKLNVDEQQELAVQFRVMSIPTLILFKNGEAVAKSVGLINKDKMKELIEANL